MMCQLDGCINEASEEYMDKETMQNIHICAKHYNRIMDIKILEEIEEEKIKKIN